EYRLDSGTWQASGSFTGLAPADYSVQIRDANATACVITLDPTLTITEPPVINMQTSFTNASCNGETDGRITVTAVEGATITIDGEAYDANATYEAGDYTVLVTVPGGNVGDPVCSDTVVITISQSAEINMQTSFTNASCNGEANGTITVTAVDGATITINGVVYNASATYGPGDYVVRAEAAGGNDSDVCFEERTITISEPADIVLTTSFTEVTCNGAADGTITASATGGATITVDGVAYSASATYGPGDYVVRAEAAGGNDSDVCFEERTITISEPADINMQTSFTNATCFGEADGNIIVTAVEGATITIDGETYNASEVYGPGDYLVRAEAAGGNDGDVCFEERTITITQPSQIIANAGNAGDLSCLVKTLVLNGSVNLENQEALDYSWTTEDGVIDSGANTLNPTVSRQGTYLLTVTNTVTNCTSMDSVNIVLIPDTEDPVFSETGDITVNVDAGECGAIVSFTTPAATDNCLETIVTFTSGLDPGSLFPVGTTTVTYTAADVTGNTSTVTFDVTVEDNEDPAIECPENITVTNIEGQDYAIVTYTEITATDNCGVTVERISGFASGEQFPIGTTTVTYVATDSSGNEV
uniref:HYR domain-containing protein n=1 Tax=Sulfitobacter sp. TaxID=1903071 RepID=UPI003566D8D1